MQSGGKNWLWGAFLFLWFGAMIAAFGHLIGYEQTPGPSIRSVSQLPPELGLPGKSGRPVLLMFLHPRCSCSEASVGELEKMLSRTRGSAEVCLFFYKPKQQSDDWIKTGLYETARRNGWMSRIDEDGLIADRFGAKTSGHVSIFDPSGMLRFSGGVTSARGHWGDNESADTALKTLSDRTSDTSARPVFGCSIQGRTEPGIPVRSEAATLPQTAR